MDVLHLSYQVVYGINYLESSEVQCESVVQGLSVCLSVRMATLPESPAAIDWSYYKSAVAKAGMVDDFEKKVRTSVAASQELPSVLSQRLVQWY